MTKRLIYLQSGFWNKVKAKDSVEDKRIFWDLYGALECSNIIADIPEECWDKDELLYRLFEKAAGGSGVKITQNAPDKIENALDPGKDQPIENLCATYLIDDGNAECDGKSIQQGILCINADMLFANPQYVHGTAIMYERDEKSDDYNKCKPCVFHTCNSILIIDPYIAIDNKHKSIDKIDKNLIPLLDRLLPEKNICGKIHITVMCDVLNSQLKKNEKKNDKILTADEIRSHIESGIRNSRKDLDYSFTLYHIKTTGNGVGDFHSRHVCTNNMLINSEDGFDLFELGRKSNEYTCGKNARIEFLYPSLMDNRRKDADNYYRWIRLAAKTANEANEVDSWGSKVKNRLFDLVD